MRFQADEPIRRRFLEEWLIGGKVKGEPITTVAFVVTLALQQEALLPPFWFDYARTWFRRHRAFESDRYAAWACHCLSLAGYEEEARDAAATVLRRRAPNGSWGRELRRTVACCYPLALSRLVSPADLEDTLSYIASKVTPGFSNDVGTMAQTLKVLFALGLVPDSAYRHLVSKVKNEGSIFCHTPQAIRLSFDVWRTIFSSMALECGWTRLNSYQVTA